MKLQGQRIAVTGASGRLGSALLATLQGVAAEAILPWRRTEFDLDAPDPRAILARDRPTLVIHCAAWTDVDGCAREPALAMRRNAAATGVLARACASTGAGMLLVSTNEVFSGDRSDGIGYAEVDQVGPLNAYGASKLAGEQAAREAFGDAVSGLWTIRTAWLYGPPGLDFPAKILAAADRLPEGKALPVAADETGSPTFTKDLAMAITQVLSATEGGLFHLVNGGVATRFAWAERVLARCRPGRAVRPISRRDFVRPSSPPAWAVLSADHACESAGVRMRDWTEAVDDYLVSLR